MKKVLVLNHFPTVIPPSSGGTLRYFHLYHELSMYYDITLLSQNTGHKSGLYRYSPTFKEYKVGLDPKWNKPRFSYEFMLIDHMERSRQITNYKEYFEKLYKTNEIIVHESPYLLEVDSYVGRDNKLRIYNSHNHEYRLAQLVWNDEKARKFLPTVYELEKRIVEHADVVFATSKMERESFISMYKKNPNQVKIAPNGIYPHTWRNSTKTFNSKPKAIFIGSEFPPNIEAVQFIIHELAHHCPEIEFVIAGGCGISFSNHKKTNVQISGRISQKQKLKLFASANMAINPMFTGTGVSLKTLEFLSAGIPLFSTKCGVRGLNLTDFKHYIQVEKDQFAAALNQYYTEDKLLEELSSNGQEYINEHYSWKSIAQGIYDEIEKFKPSSQ
ncbi:glycosyltransferase family 4 protein [Niallia endozanthoxylica]|uniref:Glycosyltransferase family 4 protein n=1 Tax=Niallia endozanthoxylica TaxID=2036016 RepID=A0A5J5HFF7_9BACI|nr:glycosyltransferase family 4 protein [Niallia endozanthoxylica]KAA9019490.1 glycosyltransferase family 4 protein [Niallia endozanthoxylica]